MNESYNRQGVENQNNMKHEMQANDQAEPQADRARSSILKAGEVGKWRPTPF